MSSTVIGNATCCRGPLLRKAFDDEEPPRLYALVAVIHAEGCPEDPRAKLRPAEPPCTCGPCPRHGARRARRRP